MRVDAKLINWYRFYLFGRLIMGVSHDLDNHLSVVFGYAELLSMNPEESEKVVKSTEKILSSAGKISSLLQQYSHYARPHIEDDDIFGVKEVIGAIISFAGYELRRSGVTLEFQEGGEERYIRGDKRSFAYMLLNIMLNASEASRKGGKVAVDLLEEMEGRVCVKVSDNGEGIPAENRERVFMENFTTREEPFHLGLGLPVSRYLSSLLRGTISFRTEEGKGTEFLVTLPAGQ